MLILTYPLCAFATESEAFCLDQHLTLLCIRFLSTPILPNPIQIQLRMVFGGYENGGTFLYDILEEYPQSRTVPFPFDGETTFVVSHEHCIIWVCRRQ